MKFHQQNVNETSAMCRHLLHFSLRQMLLIIIQLAVLKIPQHCHVTDSLKTVAWCEYKICDTWHCLHLANCIRWHLPLYLSSLTVWIFDLLIMQTKICCCIALLQDILSVLNKLCEQQACSILNETAVITFHCSSRRVLLAWAYKVK